MPPSKGKGHKSGGGAGKLKSRSPAASRSASFRSGTARSTATSAENWSRPIPAPQRLARWHRCLVHLAETSPSKEVAQLSRCCPPRPAPEVNWRRPGSILSAPHSRGATVSSPRNRNRSDDDDDDNVASTASSSEEKQKDVLPPHASPSVLHADINRSLFHLTDDALRLTHRMQLREAIARAVCGVPGDDPLYYYQGIHDVVSVLLLLGIQANVIPSPPRSLSRAAPSQEDADDDDEDDGDGTVGQLTSAAEHDLEHHFFHTSALLVAVKLRRFARKDMQATLRVLRCIHGVLLVERAAIASAMESCLMGPSSHYAMSWVITWFSHDLPATAADVLFAIFDACIGWEGDLGIVFVCAALVLRYIPEVLAERGEDFFASPDNVGDVHQVMKLLPTRLLQGTGKGTPSSSSAKASSLLRAGGELSTGGGGGGASSRGAATRRSQLQATGELLLLADQLRERHGAAVVRFVEEGDDLAFGGADISDSAAMARIAEVEQQHATPIDDAVRKTSPSTAAVVARRVDGRNATRAPFVLAGLSAVALCAFAVTARSSDHHREHMQRVFETVVPVASAAASSALTAFSETVAPLLTG